MKNIRQFVSAAGYTDVVTINSFIRRLKVERLHENAYPAAKIAVQDIPSYNMEVGTTQSCFSEQIHKLKLIDSTFEKFTNNELHDILNKKELDDKFVASNYDQYIDYCMNYIDNFYREEFAQPTVIEYGGYFYLVDERDFFIYIKDAEFFERFGALITVRPCRMRKVKVDYRFDLDLEIKRRAIV